MAFIRRALPEDAQGIHSAHMRSIREVCSRDHTPEEITGWGHRPFSEEARVKTICDDFVWVVEETGKIEGDGHMRVSEKDGLKQAHVFGLYLTPQVLNRGLGRKILELMVAEAQKEGAQTMTLGATLTAHAFYQRFGFQDDGPMESAMIGGGPVRYFPMSKKL